MKVSILVPVYNVEKYIAKCAESLFAQTYEDLEYIFVDDCSPDNSIAVLNDVLKKFPERAEQVFVIRHDRNRGLGAARKTAMENAHGDFITFADSDDFVPYDAIEKLVRKQEETGADMVDGAIDLFANGVFYDKKGPYKGAHYPELLIIQNVTLHCVYSRIIRRSIFTEHSEIEFFKEGVNMAEDYAFMCRVAFFASRTWIDDIVYHYRQDRIGTFSEGINQKHLDSYIEANHLVLNFYKNKGKKYHYPLQVGLINVAYNVLLAGESVDSLVDKLGYPFKSPMLRLAAFLLSHHVTIKLARLEYLVLKRFYITFNKSHLPS